MNKTLRAQNCWWNEMKKVSVAQELQNCFGFVFLHFWRMSEVEFYAVENNFELNGKTCTFKKCKKFLIKALKSKLLTLLALLRRNRNKKLYLTIFFHHFLSSFIQLKIPLCKRNVKTFALTIYFMLRLFHYHIMLEQHCWRFDLICECDRRRWRVGR